MALISGLFESDALIVGRGTVAGAGSSVRKIKDRVQSNQRSQKRTGAEAGTAENGTLPRYSGVRSGNSRLTITASEGARKFAAARRLRLEQDQTERFNYPSRTGRSRPMGTAMAFPHRDEPGGPCLRRLQGDTTVDPVRQQSKGRRALPAAGFALRARPAPYRGQTRRAADQGLPVHRNAGRHPARR